MRQTDVFLSICFVIVLIWLVVINLFAVYQTKRDKVLSGVPKDSSRYWRIPEAQLMLIAAFGGSVGMYLTMKSIRHKTQHPKFMIGIPAIMVLQAGFAAFLVWLKFC